MLQQCRENGVDNTRDSGYMWVTLCLVVLRGIRTAAESAVIAPKLKVDFVSSPAPF